MSRTGFIFDGWYDAAQDGEKYVSEPINPNRRPIIYRRYDELRSVSDGYKFGEFTVGFAD